MASPSRDPGGAPRRIVLALALGLVVLTPILIALVPGDTPRPQGSSTVLGPLPDGELFGFIRSMDSSSVVIDPAWLMVGRPAVAAALEDGVISVAEQLAGEVYVRNAWREEIHVHLDAAATLVVLTYDDRGGLTEARISVDELLRAFDGGPSDHAIYGLDPQAFPIRLVVADGAVAGLRQAYLPPGFVMSASSPVASPETLQYALPH